MTIKLRYPAGLADAIASYRRRRRMFFPISVGLTLVSIAATFQPDAQNVWLIRGASFFWIALWYIFEKSIRRVEDIDLAVCATEIEVDDEYITQRDPNGHIMGKLRRAELKCRSSVEAVGNAAYYLTSRADKDDCVIVFTSKLDRAAWLVRDVIKWRH